MATPRFIAVLCISLIATSFASAQEMGAKSKLESPGGVQASYLRQAKRVQGQMESLLQAIPQEKFAWRPSGDVRSIAEAFMHAGGGNYLMAKFLGGKIQEGFTEDAYEKSATDKTVILDELRKSFETVNQTIANTPESDYGNHVNFYGNDVTMLDIIFLAATHQHELLGQQIAYARMNGVVPPWTAAMQQKMKENDKKGEKR
ncbi:MAG: DinB family protein [Bacteroidota bacterium]